MKQPGHGAMTMVTMAFALDRGSATGGGCSAVMGTAHGSVGRDDLDTCGPVETTETRVSSRSRDELRPSENRPKP